MSYDFEEGSSQRITYTPNTAAYSTTVSISFWVKAESLPGAHQMHFIDLGASASWNPRNVSAYWTPAGGGTIGISWINASGPTFAEWTKAYTLSTSAWTHFYFEVDWSTNPDTVLCWINGSSQALTCTFGSNNLTPAGTYGQISVGGEHGSGTTGNYMDGLLAEIAVWSDVVGSTRASGLYNSGNGGTASVLYPTNLTEDIRLYADANNAIGGSGNLLNTPVFSSTHPFYDTKVKDLLGGFIPFLR